VAHKILLVEDDEKIVKALSVRLKAKGYEVVIAFDAVMGMAKAIEHHPDLCLLDISMPGGNGLTVAQRFQDSTVTVGTPIIFLTASKEPDLREKAMALGAVGFFEKPFESAELLAAIKNEIGAPSLHEPATVPA
jgi:DNA-binding response OmpR family regulator